MRTVRTVYGVRCEHGVSAHAAAAVQLYERLLLKYEYTDTIPILSTLQ